MMHITCDKCGAVYDLKQLKPLGCQAPTHKYRSLIVKVRDDFEKRSWLTVTKYATLRVDRPYRPRKK